MRDFIMRHLGHIHVEPIQTEYAQHLLNLFTSSLTGAGGSRGAAVTLLAPDNSEIPTDIPDEIRDRILRMCPFRKSVEFAIGKRTVRIHMRMPHNLSHNVSKYINRIYLWLSVAMKHATYHCDKPLNIFLYFSDHLKVMPANGVPIDTINANTAYTIMCKDIYIYRYEEWFKVFIHETFHNLGLDFCNMDCSETDKRLNAFFKLPDLEIRLYESYCETWALLMHSAFVAFETTRDKSRMDLMISKIKKIMDCEIRFSLFQRMKVLRHGSQENTNAFAYYVIKSSLAYRSNHFLKWCFSHNHNVMDFTKTKANIRDFCGLVERLSIDMPELPKMREPAYMRETLRMTIL